MYGLLFVLKDTTEFWSCNTLKHIYLENLYFLVTNVFSVSKRIPWYLNTSCIWQIGIKLNVSVEQGKALLTLFLRSTDIIEVLN